MAAFSDRLRMLRFEKEEKQADVAELLGVSVQSYSAYETGREPKFEILTKLAEHYGVTIDYLAGFSNLRTAEKVEINEATGLSNEAIERIRQIREFGMIDTLNEMLFHTDFMAAIGALKNIIERGYSPRKHYIILDKDDAAAFANDEKCQACVVSGAEINQPFVVRAQKRMDHVISDIATSLISRKE